MKKKVIKKNDKKVKDKAEVYKPSKREVEARKYADKQSPYRVDDDKPFPWEAHKKWCDNFWKKWGNA